MTTHALHPSSLTAYTEKPEPINWDYYRHNISIPGLVDNFQKQFEALSVPYPKDTASGTIDEQEKVFVSELETCTRHSIYTYSIKPLLADITHTCTSNKDVDMH